MKNVGNNLEGATRRGKLCWLKNVRLNIDKSPLFVPALRILHVGVLHSVHLVCILLRSVHRLLPVHRLSLWSVHWLSLRSIHWLLAVHGLLSVHGLLAIHWLLSVHGLLAIHRLLAVHRLLPIHGLLLAVHWLLSIHGLRLGWSLRLGEHDLKSIKQLSFIDAAIEVLINRPDGLQSLLLIDGGLDAQTLEQIIEEVGHLILIKGARPVGIILVEYGLDVGLEHLVLQVHTIHVFFKNID